MSTANGHAPKELLDRQLPSDHGSELMVLRAMLLDHALIDSADLCADYFHLETHRHIFAAQATLRENGQPSDVRHLHEELKRVGQLDAIGGRQALAEMLAGEPLLASTSDYLRAVRECHAKRQLYFAATTTIQDVHSGASAAEVVAKMRGRLSELDQHAEVDPLQLERLSARELINNYPELNEPVIDGLLRRGETANIIAQSKMGKSWLAY